MMKFSLKKIFSSSLILLLIVSILVPASLSLYPRKVEADIAGTKCVSTFVAWLTKSKVENTTARAQAIPVVNAGGSLTEQVQAGASGSKYVVDCIEHALALAIAKTLLTQMTNDIVQWINGGFHGDPMFVTNPGKFFGNVGDQVISDMIAGTQLENLCKPFKDHIKLAIVLNYSYKYQSGYAERSKCTLSDIIANVENYYDDFGKGGWGAWFSMTLNPHNNIYGEYLEASAQASAQIGDQKTKKTKELDWGNGFLSYEECADGTQTYAGSANNGTGVTTNEGKITEADIQKYMKDNPGITRAQAIAVLGENNSVSNSAAKPHGDCEIKTPGRTIAGVLDSQLGIPAEQLGLADDLDKIINALVNQLFEKYLFGKGGLLGATKDQQRKSAIDTWMASTNKAAHDADTAAGNNGTKSDDAINQAAQNTGGGGTSQTPSVPPTVNIAMRAVVTGTENVNNQTPSNLTNGDRVDGMSIGGNNPYTGFQTIKTANPYAQVDLDRGYNIGKVVVYPRSTGGAQNQGLNFNVQILDTNNQVIWTDPTTRVQDTQPIEVEVPNIVGRYVRVQAAGVGVLQLAELEVYTYKFPVVGLNGPATISVDIGGTFTDPGAVAQDGNGNDISETIVVTGTVDTATAGVYTLTYTAKDSNNVESKVTRRVYVR